MKIVGTRDRSEFALDPAEAWRRGRALDRMLAASAPPRRKGLVRATHAELNRQDDLRAVEIAGRLNAPAAGHKP